MYSKIYQSRQRKINRLILGLVLIITMTILDLTSVNLVFAAEPDIEKVVAGPESFLLYIIDGGGAALLAGALISILCWMSPKFNALPSEDKRRKANLYAAGFGVIAQLMVALFAYDPKILFSVEQNWKYIVYAIQGVVALNVVYLKHVRPNEAHYLLFDEIESEEVLPEVQ